MAIHDWNYLLGTLNLLPATARIAGAIRLLGTIVIVLACLGAFKYAKREDRGEASA